MSGTSSQWASACVCDPNFYMDGTGTCKSCPIGKSSSVGTTSIAGCLELICKQNQYRVTTPRLECRNCPAGSYSYSGSTSVNQCISIVCPGGHYLEESTSICQWCPQGTTSKAGSVGAASCVAAPNSPPTIVCPDDVISNTTTVTYSTPVWKDDNTTGITLNLTGPTSGSRFPVGCTPLQYSVTDAEGLTASCNFTVCVDLLPPVIQCTNVISRVNDTSMKSNLSWIPPTASDDVDKVVRVTQSSGPAPGSTFSYGVTEIGYTAQDKAGNIGVCTMLIVLDNTPPYWVRKCPIRIESETTKVTYQEPRAEDDSFRFEVTLMEGFRSGAVFPRGKTQVVWMAKDAAANSIVCGFTVYVDDTPPTIKCPSSFPTKDSVMSFPQPEILDNLDSHPQLMQTAGPTRGSSLTEGVHRVVFGAVDAAGNSAFCSFNVTVDFSPPELVCPPDMASVRQTPQYQVPVVEDVDLNVKLLQVEGPGPEGYFSDGDNTISYTAVDWLGHTTTCSFVVTIDDTAPVLKCPPSFTSNVLPPAFIEPKPSDPTVKVEAVAGLPITEGDNLIVFRATDKVHDVTCAFTITVDIRPPTLVCSSDIYSKSAVVNYPAPTCVDDRLGVKLEFLTPGLYSGAVFPYGKNVVKYRAVDQAGNEAFCQFSVVIDTERPKIICPRSITSTRAVVAYRAVNASDDSGSVDVSLVRGFESGAKFPPGETMVVYRAVDGAGNSEDCSFSVVVDTQPPQIVCPQDKVFPVGAKVLYDPPLVTDNRPGFRMAMLEGLESGSQFPPGVTEMTFQVVDAIGLSAKCNFRIFLDAEPPQISCPSNIFTHKSTVIYEPPVGVDNAPGAVTELVSGFSSASTFPLDEYVLNVFEVTDQVGLKASCNFTVFVDSQVPNISCPANMVTNKREVNYQMPEVSDNIGGWSLTLDTGLPSGVEFAVGQTMVKYTVTDRAGLTNQCSFVVYVDFVLPTIECPPDVFAENGIANYNPPVGSDDISGAVTVMTAGRPSQGDRFPLNSTTLVEYTVTDLAGNSDSCSFFVHTDLRTLNVSCPKDIVMAPGPLTDLQEPVGLEGRSLDVQLVGVSPGQVLTKPGIYNANYRVRDQFGFETTCPFKIEVHDGKPDIRCPRDIYQSDAKVEYSVTATSRLEGTITTILIEGLPSGETFPQGDLFAKLLFLL